MGSQILYVTPSFFPTVGGAEMYLVQLLKRISDHYDEVYLIAPHYAQDIKRDNINVYRTKRIPILAERSFFLYSIGMLLYFLAVKRIKIVHFSMFGMVACFGVLICKLFGVSTFVTFHGADFRLMKREGFSRRLKEYAMRQCNAISVVSQFMFQEFKDNFNSRLRLHYIPNGVDTNSFAPMSQPRNISDKTNLLFVGNVRWEKGVDILIKSLALVRNLKPTLKVNLTIVGKDSQNIVPRLSEEFNLSNQVEMRGFVDPDFLPNIYKEGDVFVLPSRKEGLALSLLEAMASGLPIIATNIPGNRSVLIDHENAILVNPEDPDALAQAIIELLSNPDLAKKIGQNARLCAESYDWEKIVEKYLELYASSLDHAN